MKNHQRFCWPLPHSNFRISINGNFYQVNMRDRKRKIKGCRPHLWLDASDESRQALEICCKEKFPCIIHFDDGPVPDGDSRPQLQASFRNGGSWTDFTLGEIKRRVPALAEGIRNGKLRLSGC